MDTITKGSLVRINAEVAESDAEAEMLLIVVENRSERMLVKRFNDGMPLPTIWSELTENLIFIR